MGDRAEHLGEQGEESIEHIYRGIEKDFEETRKAAKEEAEKKEKAAKEKAEAKKKEKEAAEKAAAEKAAAEKEAAEKAAAEKAAAQKATPKKAAPEKPAAEKPAHEKAAPKKAAPKKAAAEKKAPTPAQISLARANANTRGGLATALQTGAPIDYEHGGLVILLAGMALVSYVLTVAVRSYLCRPSEESSASAYVMLA